MKKLKKILPIFFAVVLLCAALPAQVFAAQTASGTPGSTVTASVPFSGVYGVQGTISLDNESILSNVSVSISGPGGLKAVNGKQFSYAPDGTEAVSGSIQVTATISSSANPGDVCNISVQNGISTDVNYQDQSWGSSAKIVVVAPEEPDDSDTPSGGGDSDKPSSGDSDKPSGSDSNKPSSGDSNKPSSKPDSSDTVKDVDDEAVEDEPVVDEPVVDEPVVDEPVEDEPAVDEPVLDEPSEKGCFIHWIILIVMVIAAILTFVFRKSMMIDIAILAAAAIISVILSALVGQCMADWIITVIGIVVLAIMSIVFSKNTEPTAE